MKGDRHASDRLSRRPRSKSMSEEDNPRYELFPDFDICSSAGKLLTTRSRPRSRSEWRPQPPPAPSKSMRRARNLTPEEWEKAHPPRAYGGENDTQDARQFGGKLAIEDAGKGRKAEKRGPDSGDTVGFGSSSRDFHRRVRDVLKRQSYPDQPSTAKGYEGDIKDGDPLEGSSHSAPPPSPRPSHALPVGRPTAKSTNAEDTGGRRSPSPGFRRSVRDILKHQSDQKQPFTAKGYESDIKDDDPLEGSSHSVPPLRSWFTQPLPMSTPAAKNICSQAPHANQNERKQQQGREATELVIEEQGREATPRQPNQITELIEEVMKKWFETEKVLKEVKTAIDTGKREEGEDDGDNNDGDDEDELNEGQRTPRQSDYLPRSQSPQEPQNESEGRKSDTEAGDPETRERQGVNDDERSDENEWRSGQRKTGAWD
jgi:hypothetical protein